MSTFNTPPSAASEQERIAHWLRQYIGGILALPEKDIHPETPFHNLGLDSSSSVAMTGDLGEWLGCDIDPSSAYEHPSILKLSRAVAALGTQRRHVA